MTTTPGLFNFDNADYEANALKTAIGMAEGLARTICIARLLVENGRTVDMAGLDRGVGLLCAKALDLPPDSGRSLRPTLMMVLEEANGLTEAIQNQAA
ncbi:hypothetical protein [Acidisphaera sp. L21]|jgi:hypothetical protein|uniref:hypothetical protein n=1 Tax=Acidisphaera sp. L21 TaxID=1641851 RepID=UPI00131B4BE5|nr:hypothetical protein [Acidisphaera sp. L21]